MDGHGCGCQVEVVEEDGQVVVQAPRRTEPEVERAAGHALDRTGKRPKLTFVFKLLRYARMKLA